MVNKQALKNTRKKIRLSKDGVPELSDKQIYLNQILAANINQIKKLNKLIAQLNHNVKIIKQLIDEVK